MDFPLETENPDLEEKLPDEDYLREMLNTDNDDIIAHSAEPAPKIQPSVIKQTSTEERKFGEMVLD